MAKHLVSSGQLLGKTRAEIERDLGPSSRLTHIVVAEVLDDAFKQSRPSGLWDEAMAYPVRWSATYHLPVCSELGIRFGVSWQVVPSVVPELLSDPDSEKSRRAFEAMLRMKKLDIDKLKRAYEGKQAAPTSTCAGRRSRRGSCP
jgi:hypothetical protein